MVAGVPHRRAGEKCKEKRKFLYFSLLIFVLRNWEKRKFFHSPANVYVNVYDCVCVCIHIVCVLDGWMGCCLIRLTAGDGFVLALLAANAAAAAAAALIVATLPLDLLGRTISTLNYIYIV